MSRNSASSNHGPRNDQHDEEDEEDEELPADWSTYGEAADVGVGGVVVSRTRNNPAPTKPRGARPNPEDEPRAKLVPGRSPRQQQQPRPECSCCCCRGDRHAPMYPWPTWREPPPPRRPVATRASADADRAWMDAQLRAQRHFYIVSLVIMVVGLLLALVVAAWLLGPKRSPAYHSGYREPCPWDRQPPWPPEGRGCSGRR